MKTSVSTHDRQMLLREDEAAEVFGVTGRTVRRWTADGLLPRVKVAGTVRYRLADVEALISRSLEKQHDPDGGPGRAKTDEATVDVRPT